MKNSLLSAQQIAAKWGCNRTTAARILRRYGYSGYKFGSAKQSIRRYAPEDIEQVERIVRSNAGSGENTGTTAQGHGITL